MERYGFLALSSNMRRDRSCWIGVSIHIKTLSTQGLIIFTLRLQKVPIQITTMDSSLTRDNIITGYQRIKVESFNSRHLNKLRGSLMLCQCQMMMRKWIQMMSMKVIFRRCPRKQLVTCIHIRNMLMLVVQMTRMRSWGSPILRREISKLMRRNFQVHRNLISIRDCCSSRDQPEISPALKIGFCTIIFKSRIRVENRLRSLIKSMTTPVRSKDLALRSSR